MEECIFQEREWFFVFLFSHERTNGKTTMLTIELWITLYKYSQKFQSMSPRAIILWYLLDLFDQMKVVFM